MSHLLTNPEFSSADCAEASASRIVPKTPAVVVGADADGLGIARSLGVAGVSVILVDVNARRPGMHSRSVRPYVVDALSGAVLVEGLLALRAHLDSKPALYLTSDAQVRTISEHRKRMEGAFYHRLPSHRSVCALLHKAGFQREAERHGFPVPRAISVRDERDLTELDKIRFPAVIKPGNKDLFFSGKVRRAWRVASREEADSICRAILPQARDLLVQEWVEGQESDIYFCLQYRGEGGVTVRSFTGRKLRCWPPQTGSTASCTVAPAADAELERQTTAFFDKTQFTGMCSMEFKRDCRNGKFFMIEPTVGRTDWQEEVATLNGVNIPLAAYCYELGQAIPAVRNPRNPVTWMYPPSYLRSVLAKGSFGGTQLEVRRMKTPCWSFDDPIPFVYFMREWFRKLPSRSRWRELIREQRWRINRASTATTEGSIRNPTSLTHAALRTASDPPSAKKA